MSDPLQLLGELTLEQRAELELQLMRTRTGLARAAVPRREKFSPCPLSFGQQRLWFLNQLAPHSPFYNFARALGLSGMLNAEALQQALDTIVSRHEVLRTTFNTVDGQPLQMIAKDRSATMAVIDLGSLPTAERETEVQRILKHEAQRPFDL